ncbi:hypothetical protein IJG90_01065 [Candidatus Saccharibacteria bacterium]|nr:hypothetical protein [Candidatus Saccharibacteria bacterium]
MKSRCLFFISTLPILLSSTIAPVGAYASDGESAAQDYYTVDEILPLRGELAELKDRVCEGDARCKERFRYEFDESEALLSAINGLENVKFTITDINPVAHTIKFLYFDEGFDYETMEIGHFNINELFIFSLEDYMGNPERSGGLYYEYIERIRTEDAPEGINTLVFDTKDQNPEDWFPSGEEVTYYIEDFSSIPEKIHIVLNTERGYSIKTTDLSSCLTSPDYLAGEANSYQFILVPDGEFYTRSYLPYQYVEPEEVVTPDAPETPETSDDPETPEAPDTNNATNTPDTTEESEATDNLEPSSHLSTDALEPIDAPTSRELEPASLIAYTTTAPQASTQELVATQTTTQATKDASNAEESATANREVEALESASTASSSRDVTVPRANVGQNAFPWWILLLLVPGISVLVWWFWPHKKAQKDSKNA